MKRLILTLAAVVAIVSSTLSGQSRIVETTTHSEILGVDKPVTIYLPAGYDAAKEQRYPVLYLLHGAWGCNEDWVKSGNMKQIADETIASGLAEPMIIVMPDARGNGKNYAGKNMGYFNQPGWNYEDYFFEELIPYVDANYRTVAEKSGRSIAGLSMGGGGATVYAQRHPDMFRASSSMSGLVGNAGQNASADMDGAFLKSVADTDATMFLVNATPGQLEALRSVRWLADCGDDDFLSSLNVAYYEMMKKRYVPIEYRMRDGSHTWRYWQTALPTVLAFSF